MQIGPLHGPTMLETEIAKTHAAMERNLRANLFAPRLGEYR